jgi:hypothetical protein
MAQQSGVGSAQPGAGDGAAYFHVGVVVPDLEQAMHELTRALGVQWMEPQERVNDPYSLRITFSREAPHIELIEGLPNSPWDTAAGPHLDHLGFWTEGVEDVKRHLAETGVALEIEGPAPFGGGWSYHRGPHSGVRIELCDATARNAFYARWGLPVDGH